MVVCPTLARWDPHTHTQTHTDIYAGQREDTQREFQALFRGQGGRETKPEKVLVM